MNVSPLNRKLEASDVAPERLAGNPQLTEEQKVGEATRQFEAILLRQILASTQKAVIKSRFTDDSTASGIYQDMITSQLADSISKSGSMGLAKTLEHEFTQQAHATAKTAHGHSQETPAATAGADAGSGLRSARHAHILRTSTH